MMVDLVECSKILQSMIFFKLIFKDSTVKLIHVSLDEHNVITHSACAEM